MSSGALTTSAPRSTALRLGYQRCLPAKSAQWKQHSENSVKHYPWPKELVKLLEDGHIVIQIDCGK